RMRRTLDWEPWFEVAAGDLPYREKLTRYAAIARQRLAAAEFEDFCGEHLAHLDQVAADFFASPAARDAVHRKVSALFPTHEVEQYTDLFVGRIQRWRDLEGRG
ncbi:MAG TPA: hypothetical protein VGA44_10335, partial [Steroidobacteraceae bacterium]